MTHRAPIALILVILLLRVAAPASAAAIAHREVLPNGIVLLVAERPGVPIIAVRAFMRAGAAFEPRDRAGLANLTGSLLTRGTAKRTRPDLDATIEFVGGSLEAAAGRDGLTTSLSVLKRDLPLGLDLLSEVVLSPTFPEAELKPTTPTPAPSRGPSSRSASSPATTSWPSTGATCGRTARSSRWWGTSPWPRRVARCWRGSGAGRVPPRRHPPCRRARRPRRRGPRLSPRS